MSHELGDFLRARRADARLEPPGNGMLVRRRVIGLRREEVATTAGISVDYYTRLEQGRETNPSDAVLDSLARVLCLQPDEVDHLRVLRGSSARARSGATSDAALLGRMSALVEAVRPNPAYVLDQLANVVASNPEGLALFDGLAEVAPQHRNTCRYLLTHPRAREVFVDWEDVARGAVAHLRAANAHDLDDTRLQDLVADLTARSPLFGEWWNGHLVQRRRAAAERIRDGHRVDTRRFEVLHLPEDRLRMTIWL